MQPESAPAQPWRSPRRRFLFPALLLSGLMLGTCSRMPGALERRALELAEERDRALAALKELEFDHRTGKISDDDYRELVGPLRRRVAEALRALEPRAETTEEAVKPPVRVSGPPEGNGKSHA